MSTLKETLHADLTEAIRSRNAVVAATLRMALTAISTAETAGTTHRELSDDEVLKVLVKEGKKRREASAAYTGAGRPELAAREDAEFAVLDLGEQRDVAGENTDLALNRRDDDGVDGVGIHLGFRGDDFEGERHGMLSSE